MGRVKHFLSICAVAAVTACVAAGQQVRFQSAALSPVDLSGSMTKPNGNGPFPAVILLHGGAGLDYMVFIADLQRDLANAGFVTLAFDSWTARGLGPPDRTPMGPELTIDAFGGRLLDTYGAIRFLQSQPYVDPERIALMGFSDGGRVAIHVAGGVGPNGQPFRPGPMPRVAIGYYPVCYGPTGGVARGGPAGFRKADHGTDLPAVKVPLLVHVAGRDNWPGSRPAICASVLERFAKSGGPFERYDYPEAYHTFNDSRLSGVRAGPQGTVGYHGESARLAWERTMAFLRKHLIAGTAAN